MIKPCTGRVVQYGTKSIYCYALQFHVDVSVSGPSIIRPSMRPCNCETYIAGDSKIKGTKAHTHFGTKIMWPYNQGSPKIKKFQAQTYCLIP